MNLVKYVSILIALPLVAAAAPALEGEDAPVTRDPEVVELFSTLPVQSGGRVKPLHTLAGFELLKMNGRRKCVTPGDDPERLTQVEWLLDCFFFPERAVDYEIFLIQNSDVLTAVGLEFADKKKRDRYSYRQLAPGMDALFDQVHSIGDKEPSRMTPVERQTMDLARNVRDFERLIRCFDFARFDLRVDGSERLSALFDGAERVSLSAVLAKAGDLSRLWIEVRDDSSEGGVEARAVGDLLSTLENIAGSTGNALALIAPSVPAESETQWLAPTDVVGFAFTGVQDVEQQIEALAMLERLEASKSDPTAFKAELQRVHGRLTGLADARGEYGKIPLEVSFYRTDYFYRALLCFLAAFLMTAFTWLAPRAVWLNRGAWVALALGQGLLVGGIVMRCILRSRPPVSTLYETILFITAVCVLVAMIIEWINRMRIASTVASVLGVLGMFLAMKYEVKEAVTAGDTMPSLVAVLDTNFWLATHVTTVTMGYAAGLFASALAHVWLLGKIFGFKKRDRAFFTSVTRMIYGVTCFGLLFSVVGTILGGIWANYSWGRFWGWDPKENGALMICLWMLLTLHARMGGYIKQFGLAVMSVLGGLVVAFSWWGVNLLGVGLHSYGFTSGVFLTLFVTYAAELGVVVIALGWWFAQRGNTPGGLA